MRRNLGTIVSLIAFAGILAGPGAGETTISSSDRNRALGVIRLVTAAEADYFHRTGRYATFTELVKSGQFGKTATDAPESLRAFFSLDFKSESDPLPGFDLKLAVSPVGSAYTLSLAEKTDKCGFHFLTDEKGGVLEGKTENCAVETAADVAPENWAPPDIDQSLPVLHGDGPCPLDTVLEETSHRVEELSENLQKFSAKERIEHRELAKNGKLRGPTLGNYNYVAEVYQAEAGTTYIEEYRSAINGVPDSTTPFVDTGTAAFALIFHPRHVDEFAMTCEGKADAGGRPAWLVRFAQRPDRKNEFHAYRVKGQLYHASVKGRAWIAADNYEVVRMETDLMAPIPEIALEREHLVIEYGPVEFRKRDLRLWLPESATLYIDFHGHRYARTHQFSDFELFSVDTVEKVKVPAVAKGEQGQQAPSPGSSMGLMPGDAGPRPPIPANEFPPRPK